MRRLALRMVNGFRTVYHSLKLDFLRHKHTIGVESIIGKGATAFEAKFAVEQAGRIEEVHRTCL